VLNEGTKQKRRDSSLRSEDNIAMATLLPAWEMMEGEAVEIFTPTFKYSQSKVARTAL